MSITAKIQILIEVEADRTFNDKEIAINIKKIGQREILNTLNDFIKTYPKTIKVIGKPKMIKFSYSDIL